MSGLRPSGKAGWKKAALSAVGFCLMGLFLEGAPGIIYGQVTNSEGGQQAIALVPGPDAEVTCPTYPCATVSASSSGSAEVSLSLGIDSDEASQPETYYTDLIVVTDTTGPAVTIDSVALSPITATSQSDYGSITLYYCQAQTDTPQTGCEGSFTSTSGAGGFAFEGADQLGRGAVRYLELSGFAGPGARPGDTLSFTIEVSAG